MQRLRTFLEKSEDGLGATALLLMALLPVTELCLRTFFNTGIPGTSGYVQHLTLWVAFLGAMIASKQDRHINLSSGIIIVPKKLEAPAKAIAGLFSTAVTTGLCWASIQFIRTETETPLYLGNWLPVWAVELILPISFAVMAARFVLQAGAPAARIVAALGIPLAAVLGLYLSPLPGELVWPAIIGLIAAALLGAPIFIALGGAALILFFAEDVSVAAIPVETYRIVVSPTIPAIPLFTLTGYLLAEGRSSERLVRLFRALFGWMPGGLIIATTLVCAFFSTFTGASGVTILALGALLLPVLMQNGFSERFSIGLLTSTGSIGLLFPPSLAVILYAVIAKVPINDMFVAGIVPGILMVSAVSLYGLIVGFRTNAPRTPFSVGEAIRAIWQAKWEIMLPVVALVFIFGGITTLVEAAAITVAYALVMQVVIHRDLHLTGELPGVVLQSVTLIGGVFVILGVAMGLTNYLVDAMIPMQAAAWVEANVESKIVFLLALNVFLLVVGSLMDIYSAIIVVVPLIVPISQVFGINPLHLGMIFLVNLELGYLTPPVGMNLFLAAFRFDRPLIKIYLAALPFLLVLLVVVVLITYVPALIIGVD